MKSSWNLHTFLELNVYIIAIDVLSAKKLFCYKFQMTYNQNYKKLMSQIILLNNILSTQYIVHIDLRTS